MQLKSGSFLANHLMVAFFPANDVILCAAEVQMNLPVSCGVATLVTGGQKDFPENRILHVQ